MVTPYLAEKSEIRMELDGRSSGLTGLAWGYFLFETVSNDLLGTETEVWYTSVLFRGLTDYY